MACSSGYPAIINAAGTLTRLSGAPLAPGVLEAMTEANGASADMFQVQAHASRQIAAATGAEAGLATAGAAAGLLLASAACLARYDPGRMNRLPQTDGRDQIIVARGHRNGYDHALRAAGARLVEIGLPEPLAGAGVRNAEPWEYADAIGPDTAAIHYVASEGAEPTLEQVVRVARARDVPVTVDAAAELPPQANLRRFVEQGASLVVFSGGKVLGGPAGTGLLAGDRDLIASAALQCLDVDIRFEDFAPPADFIDKSRLAGLPRQGIGRTCKVGKNEIAGLLAALDHFVTEGDAARHARWLTLCRRIEADIAPAGRFAVSLDNAGQADRVPLVVLRCPDQGAAQAMRAGLLARPVAVHTRLDPYRPECLILNPVGLREAELPALIEALNA